MNLTTPLVWGSLAMPLFWILGIEQFVGYGLMLVIIASFLRNGTLPLPSRRMPSLWLIPLMAAAIVAVTSLTNAPSSRLLTYARDFLTLATLTVVLMTHRSHVQPMHDSARLITAGARLAAVASLIGIVAFALDYDGSFTTPFGYLLPPSVRNTGLGHVIAEKSLIWAKDSRILSFELNRVRSMFLYPNTFALALGIGIPLLLLRVLERRSGPGFVLSLIGLVAAVLCLAASTSRSAIGATLAGLATFVYLRAVGVVKPRQRILVHLTAAIVLAAAVVAFLGALMGTAEQLIYLRGRGSVDHRALIYAQSLRAVLENPLGYGTYRDVPGFGDDIPPLGSHSQYISVLFKYGFAGLLFYLIFLFTVFRSWLRGYRLSAQLGSPDARLFYPLTGWALASNSLHQVTAELTLDLLSLLFAMLLWLAIDLRTQHYTGIIGMPRGMAPTTDAKIPERT